VGLSLLVFSKGALLSFGLILAIGAQNAFVLRQGLRGEHVFLVCSLCVVSDALLISAGVAGFGLMVERAPWIEPVFRYGGAAFSLCLPARWHGVGWIWLLPWSCSSWRSICCADE